MKLEFCACYYSWDAMVIPIYISAAHFIVRTSFPLPFVLHLSTNFIRGNYSFFKHIYYCIAPSFLETSSRFSSGFLACYILFAVLQFSIIDKCPNYCSCFCIFFYHRNMRVYRIVYISSSTIYQFAKTFKTYLVYY